MRSSSVPARGGRNAELAEALVEAVRDPGAAQLVLYCRVVGGS